MTHLIETPHTLLRPIELANASGILAHDSDPEVLRYVPNVLIGTLAEATAGI